MKAVKTAGVQNKGKQEKLKIVSLFSGAGGLDYAFDSTKRFQTILAIEHQKEFCETLEAAVAKNLLSIQRILCADIHAINPLDLLPGFNHDEEKLDGVIGGPPCEAFSSMGRKRGVSDSRGLLVYELMRFVEELLPRFFLIENVPAFGTMHDGKVLKDVKDRMSALGYQVSHDVVCAADFGAATVRKRLIIIGLLADQPFVFPKPTHFSSSRVLADDVRKWIPSSAVLGDLPPPSAQSSGTLPNHVAIEHTPAVCERFAGIPPGGYDYVRKRSRLHWDYPSPSLVAGDLRQTRSLIHPLEPRELTNLECARIQGFPDDYPFSGNKNKIAKQITNSVPIALGTALANALLMQLTKSSISRATNGN